MLSKKSFRLTISTPLPSDFLKVCTDLDIKIDPNEVTTGISIDDMHTRDGDLSKYLTDLRAQWMPVWRI